MIVEAENCELGKASEDDRGRSMSAAASATVRLLLVVFDAGQAGIIANEMGSVAGLKNFSTPTNRSDRYHPRESASISNASVICGWASALLHDIEPPPT